MKRRNFFAALLGAPMAAKAAVAGSSAPIPAEWATVIRGVQRSIVAMDGAMSRIYRISPSKLTNLEYRAYYRALERSTR